MNYYRRYLGDYMRDTAHLSITEHGAYNLLLDHCYATEKPLPAVYEALYRLCRAMSKQEQDAVRSIADEFFKLGDDGLRHNPRADREIAIGQATIDKQRKSGVESANKRWSTDKSTHGSDIQPPTTNHHTPASNLQSPDKNIRASKSRDVPAKSRKKKTSIPEDFGEHWTPSMQEWIAKHSNGQTKAHLIHFIGYAKANGKQYADWEQAFQNAVRDDWAGVRKAGL